MVLNSNQKKTKIISYIIPFAITMTGIVITAAAKGADMNRILPNAVRCGLMAFSMFFYLNHCRFFGGTPIAFKKLFAIMYALSGYTIVRFSYFDESLDTAVLFPLLMLAFFYAADKGNCIMLMLVLSCCVFLNTESGILLGLYCFLLALVYVLLRLFSVKQRDISQKLSEILKPFWNVLLGIVGAAGIDICVMVPYFKLYHRVGITDYANAPLSYKYWILYGTTFLWALLVMGILKYHKEQTFAEFILAVIVLSFVFTAAFDSVEFILPFMLIFGGAFYAGKPLEKKGGSMEEKVVLQFYPMEVLVYVLSAMVWCGIAAYLYNKLQPVGLVGCYVFYGSFFVLLGLLNGISCILNKGFFSIKNCYVYVALELFIILYGLFSGAGFVI